MKLRKLWVLGIVLMMICSLFGCEKKKKSDNKTIILSEVAHSIFYAPQYVAIEKGYFKDEGLNIKLVNAAGADNVMTSLISGNADIGFMGSEASVYIYNEGADDYAVNFAGLTQRAGNFLVARTKEGTIISDNDKLEEGEGKDENARFEWSKLKGKTVLGGRAGGMPQMVFEYILKKNNIDPKKDLNIIQNVDFGLTAAAFSSGDADYTIEFEPFASALEAANKGYVVASLGEESGYVPYTAYCAKKSYIKDHPEEILAFTKALQRGLDFVNSNSAMEIAKVIKPQFKETSLDELEVIVSRYKNQDTWKVDTVFEKDAYDLLIMILMEAKVIDKIPPYEDIITTEFSIKSLGKK